MLAKPNPIWTPTNSPARPIAARVNCIAKPMAMPTRICSTARTAVVQDSSSGADCFTAPAIAMVTTKASATLARTGIATELNAGADANKARVRKNGQKNWPSQPAKSASVTLSTGSFAQIRAHHRSAFDAGRKASACPRRGEVNHQEDREKARHETQGQIVHPRRGLEQPDQQACQHRGGQE